MFESFRTDADMAEELRSHFEELVEDGVAIGLTREEAKRRARLKLGSPPGVLERIRDGELSTMLESWYKDFTLGLRSIRRNPVFAITAILTLGVGIGANTVVFTLLYGLLLRSLPVQDPQQLVRIGVLNPTATVNPVGAIPYHMVKELQRRQSFTGISIWTVRNASVETNEGMPRMVLAALPSGNGFDVLGLKPYLGRLLKPEDDIRGGPATGWSAVLGHGFWMENYGGDPAILGKQIRIANTLVTVVGIAPPAFRGVTAGSDTKVYLPFQFNVVMEGKDNINPPESFTWCLPIARLKPGVSSKAALAELAVYQKDLLKQYVPPRIQQQPWFQSASLALESARTGMPTFFGRVHATPLYLMQGLVGIVLLLCCVDVGGLMMSKV